MKKFLAIILGAIFVLSFAASAFAIHAEIPAETQAVVGVGSTQITIGGEIRTRGWYFHNVVNADGSGKKAINGLPGDGGSSAYYDQRVRLSVDAKVTPNVEGFIMLESGNEINGTGTAGGDRYIWGNFDRKPADIKILEDWIMYTGQGLLGVPAGIKIGHMPLALGEQQFFQHTKFGDDAIVFFMDPIKELHIALLTIKFAGDGGNGGVISKDAPFGTRESNTDDLDGYVGLAVFKWDPKNAIGINYTYLNLPAVGKKESDLGLHANGDISGFTYKAEADFQFGDKAHDQKAKGYGFMAGIGFQTDPVGIRASAAYGSGDDNGSGEKLFDTFQSNVQHYTLVYEYNVISAAGGISTGIANTTYFNLGVDFTPMKALTASLDGYILRATKRLTDGGSKNVGWEADAKIVYNVARNLNYQVDAGYFKAGDFYPDTFLGADNKGVTVLRHMITLSF